MTEQHECLKFYAGQRQILQLYFQQFCKIWLKRHQ